MATKDDLCLSNKKQASLMNNNSNNGNQYSNLNLNQNFSNSNKVAAAVDSTAKSFGGGDKQYSVNHQEVASKTSHLLLDKSMKSGLSPNMDLSIDDPKKNNKNAKIDVDNDESDDLDKMIKKHNNEAGIFGGTPFDKAEWKKEAATLKKLKNVKQVYTSAIQASFEFPRQQKENQLSESIKPEVMQFKASQKLLAPNDATSATSAAIPTTITTTNGPTQLQKSTTAAEPTTNPPSISSTMTSAVPTTTAAAEPTNPPPSTILIAPLNTATTTSTPLAGPPTSSATTNQSSPIPPSVMASTSTTAAANLLSSSHYSLMVEYASKPTGSTTTTSAPEPSPFPVMLPIDPPPYPKGYYSMLPLLRTKYQLFKAQDEREGNFDVIFMFGDKALYCWSNDLMICSEKMRGLLNGRWLEQNDPIAIEEFLYKDFNEFLYFIYFHFCYINQSNYYQLLKIAQRFGVEQFKIYIEQILCENVSWLSVNNVGEFSSVGYQFGLSTWLSEIKKFSKSNFNRIISSGCFNNFCTSFVFMLLYIDRSKEAPEVECNLFQAMIRWAEKKSTVVHSMGPPSIDYSAVKNRVKVMMWLINYAKMSCKFATQHLVKDYAYLFGRELYNVLLQCRRDGAKEEETTFRT